MLKGVNLSSSQIHPEEKRAVYAQMRLLNKIVHGMNERMMESECATLGLELGFDVRNCYVLVTGMTRKGLLNETEGSYRYYESAPRQFYRIAPLFTAHGFREAHFYDVSSDALCILATPDLPGDHNARALAEAVQRDLWAFLRAEVVSGNDFCALTVLSPRVESYDQLAPAFEEAMRLRSLDFFYMEPMVIDGEWERRQRRPLDRQAMLHVLRSLETSVELGDAAGFETLLETLERMLCASLDMEGVRGVAALLENRMCAEGQNGELPARRSLYADGYPTLRALMREARAQFQRLTAARCGTALSELTRQALVYMNTHYRERLTQQDVAAAVGVVPQYLSSLFNREMGFGVPAYLNRLRIRDAKTLLRETDMKVSQVARHVGLGDSDHFYPLFRRLTGVTPTQYREQARQEKATEA